MKNTKTLRKLKNFCIGLGFAGMASLGFAANTQAHGRCTGVCSQCGTCCLGILSLGLWLVEKRWRPIARIWFAVAHRFNVRPGFQAGSKGKDICR